MVIKNPKITEYIGALKKLFPQGNYWDSLLTDSSSDLSIICTARAQELADFRVRMNRLQAESYPDSAEETIENWETVYLGYTNGTLVLDQRRDLLLAQKSGSVSINILKQLAQTYGCAIHRIEYPYTPATFGHSCFGQAYIGFPATLAVLFIYATAPDGIRSTFEAAIERILLANQILFFIYNGGTDGRTIS